MLAGNLQRRRRAPDSGDPLASLFRALCGTRYVHWHKWNTTFMFRQQDSSLFFRWGIWSNAVGAKKASIAREGNSDWPQTEPTPKGIWLPAILYGLRYRHGPGRSRAH